jgi:hypothetical protein
LTDAVYNGLVAEKSKMSHLYSYFNAFCNNNIAATILFLAILIAFAVSLLVMRKKLSVYNIIIIGWFIIPYSLMFLISFKLPIANPRYMIFITPALFLTIMIGINYLGRNIKVLTIGLSLFCVFLIIKSTDLNYSLGFQSKDAVSIIRKHKSNATRVFIFPPWIDIVFTYHYNLDSFKHPWAYKDDLKKDNIFIISWPKDMDTLNLSNVQDVLLLVGWGADGRDPDKTIQKKLCQKIGNMDTIAKLKSYSIFHYGNKTSK